MKKTTVTDVLDEAASTARGRGHVVDGWILQGGDNGYVAWLYFETDDEQISLSDSTVVYDTAEQAADALLEETMDLYMAAFEGLA